MFFKEREDDVILMLIQRANGAANIVNSHQKQCGQIATVIAWLKSLTQVLSRLRLANNWQSIKSKRLDNESDRLTTRTLSNLF